MSGHNDENTPSPRQQRLLDLVDRVSQILESKAPAEQTASDLCTEYGRLDALDLAQACAKSFPGKRNSNKALYWETVCELIRKEGATTH